MFEQKRQHPLMIPLGAVSNSAYMLIPLGILLFQNLVGTDSRAEAIRDLLIFLALLGASLLVSLLYQTLKWAFYTYRYEEGYLHIKSGIIFKKERSIKQERVQTVNIRTGILQRLLGLATLQVETAGGGMESELSLTAVAREEAFQIKESLEQPWESQERKKKDSHAGEGVPSSSLLERAVGPTATSVSGEEAGELIYRMSLPDLLFAGATSGGFLLLFSLIAAAFSQLYPHIPQGFWDYLLEQITSTTAATVILVVIVLLLLSWLLSTIIFAIQYANFTLKREENQLQASWGLIEQKQLTLQMHRLQALVVHEGLLRQPFGKCALVAEVAGGGSRQQDYITLLFPLLSCSELSAFLEKMLPEYHLPVEWQPLPLRSRRRYLFRVLAPTLLLVVPLQWVPYVPYGWLGFLLLVPAFILGWARYQDAGTSLTPRQLSFRFRFINRHQIFMLRNHVQAFQVRVNPFQRWWKLRSVRAWVLSSPAGKEFKLADVGNQESERLWQWYSRCSKNK